MRLDIAEELTKPLGHLCVEKGIKATAYVNAAVRVALIRDGEIPTEGWRRGRPWTAVNRVPVMMANGSEGFASCDEDGWHTESGLAGDVVGWRHQTDVVVAIPLEASSVGDLPDLPADEQEGGLRSLGALGSRFAEGSDS